MTWPRGLLHCGGGRGYAGGISLCVEDLTWYLIKGLETVGLASDLKYPNLGAFCMLLNYFVQLFHAVRISASHALDIGNFKGL